VNEIHEFIYELEGKQQMSCQIIVRKY